MCWAKKSVFLELAPSAVYSVFSFSISNSLNKFQIVVRACIGMFMSFTISSSAWIEFVKTVLESFASVSLVFDFMIEARTFFGIEVSSERVSSISTIG